MRRDTLTILVPWLKRYRRDLLLAVFAGLVAQALGIALPLVARWAIHQIRREPGAVTDIPALDAPRFFLTVGVLMLGIAVLRSGARWIQSVYGERLGHRVLARLRIDMFRHLQRLSRGYFDRRPSGKIMIRFIGDANALRTWLARTVVSVPADVLAVILVMIVVLVIRPILVLGLVLPLVLAVPVFLWINPRARRRTREGRRHQTRLCGLLGETIPNIRVVKAHRLEDEGARRVNTHIEGIADVGIARAHLDAWLQASALGLTTVALGAVVVTGTWQLMEGNITHGDLLAVVWMTLQIRGPVNRLSRANVIHQRAVVALDRIGMLLKRKPERGWSDDLAPYAGPGDTIEFRDVGYKDASGAWVVRGLTEHLEGPGLVCLRDGSSGAGQVLLDLVLRIRRPHEGRIHLDGKDIRTLRVPDIRSRIGLVDGARLDTATLLDLMTLHGASEHFEDRFVRAWDAAANLAPDASLPELLRLRETHGANHSHGAVLAYPWCLRLACSLALLDDPVVLLMDEPFAQCPGDCRPAIVDWVSAVAAERLVIISTEHPAIFESHSHIVDLGASRFEPIMKTAGPTGDNIPGEPDGLAGASGQGRRLSAHQSPIAGPQP